MNKDILVVVLYWIERHDRDWLNILLVCKEWKETALSVFKRRSHRYYSKYIQPHSNEPGKHKYLMTIPGYESDGGVLEQLFQSRLIESERVSGNFNTRVLVTLTNEIELDEYNELTRKLVNEVNGGCVCDLKNANHSMYDCPWERYRNNKEKPRVFRRKQIIKNYRRGSYAYSSGVMCNCDQLGEDTLCNVCNCICCPFAYLDFKTKPFTERKGDKIISGITFSIQTLCSKCNIESSQIVGSVERIEPGSFIDHTELPVSRLF